MKNKGYTDFKLPFYTPQYLTENHLWDSEWLIIKYPNYFKNQINK
jgi:hypothetical protein